jgi:Ca2+-binding EF-hand superfamily protein
LFTQWKTGK